MESCQINSTIMDLDYLGSDLTDMILFRLPISSIIRASCVSKTWRSIITSSAFTTSFLSTNKPRLFLYGYDNTCPDKTHAFCFDPEAIEWVEIPTRFCTLKDDFIGSHSFLINISVREFSFKPMINGSWRKTKPLSFSRQNALISAYDDKFIVAGGISHSDGPDHVLYRLPTEIYDPDKDIWELFPAVPAELQWGSSIQGVSSTLFKRKFYVHGWYSHFVSYFDLKKHVWSEVQTLMPPGVVYSFLVACQDVLILAGYCNSRCGTLLNLWKIDEITMEFAELATMPDKLLNYMCGTDDKVKFAILKFVGLGNFLYVINEDPHLNYPVCVYEVDKSVWRMVPDLQFPVNKFDKIVSFCSYVSL